MRAIARKWGIKMIIVKFHGGLGNQMYQYAFYRELKRKYPDVNIKADLDRYIYEKYKEHNGFELDSVFDNIQLEIATTREILLSGGEYERHSDGIVDIIVRFIWNKGFRYLKRHHCIFEDQWESFSDICEKQMKLKDFWLCGYWAESIYNNIPDFVFRNDMDMENQWIMKEIQSSHSVSIHVRRGDYVGVPSLDIIRLDYYKRAVEFLNNRIGHLKYFIFSDDKEYIEKNFSFIDDKYIVKNNVGNDSYKDMQLMSCCQHNIICNSTFSFWGALLNKNPNKIVIVPDGYLKNAVQGLRGQWVTIKDESDEQDDAFTGEN